ncbi:MAG TPA: phage tail tube protein [Acidisoma sp.]|nr:phage tail tube protein [Acidisoma sp.]
MSGSSIYGASTGTPSARGGTASIEVDGDVIDLVGDGNYDATTVTREPLIGQSGPQGFSEMPKYGTIGGQFRDAGNLTVSAIKAKTSSSVKLTLINGKTVSGDGMFCTECSPVATQEGTFNVTFAGTVTENPAS